MKIAVKRIGNYEECFQREVYYRYLNRTFIVYLNKVNKKFILIMSWFNVVTETV